MSREPALRGPGPPRLGAEPGTNARGGAGRGGPGAGLQLGTHGGDAGGLQARSEAAPAAASWIRVPRTTSSTAT